MNKLFESRKSHLDYRIKRDYIRNGAAVIPCKISNFNDVINTYSVKNYEILNQEFVDYIEATAEVIPTEYPLVVDIIEDCLSDEDRKNIEETIRDEFAYSLGIVEKEEQRHKKRFIFMLIGLIISAILMVFMESLGETLLGVTESFGIIPRELVVIMFYFMGDTLCDYIFLTGHDLRRERRLAGRLASIKVVFSKKYKGNDYTKSEVEQLYSEIEEDVNKTIRQKDDVQ